eukprot:6981-Heterococcus_DN1.PRE.2
MLEIRWVNSNVLCTEPGEGDSPSPVTLLPASTILSHKLKLFGVLGASRLGVAAFFSMSAQPHTMLQKTEVQTVAQAAMPFKAVQENNFEALRLRADITKALIEHEDFTAVLCEADFPPMFELTRYIDSIPQPRKAVAAAGSAAGSEESATKKRQVSEVEGPPKTVDEAMAGLKERFPLYCVDDHHRIGRARVVCALELCACTSSSGAVALQACHFTRVCTLYATTHTARRWYNEATRDLIEWLKEFNGKKKPSDTPPVPIAMLGLDIYSLFTSADEVISYLEAVDPEAAVTARKRYSLLSSFRPEVSHYVHALHAGLIKSQSSRVEAVLRDISQRRRSTVTRH